MWVRKITKITLFIFKSYVRKSNFKIKVHGSRSAWIMKEC